MMSDKSGANSAGFAHEAAPALTRFADSSPGPFVDGVRAARARIVARTNEDRTEFLRKRGFGKAETAKILETVLGEGPREARVHRRGRCTMTDDISLG